MIKTSNEQVIEVNDLDDLVKQTYGRPYDFQQQDGCKDRQSVYVTVPESADDYTNDTLPEECNGEKRGVSFKAWLAADPKRELRKSPGGWNFSSLWWGRNFYPDIQMVLNDLHKKGLIEAGDYTIKIDW